jgi:hypothetical protein
MPDVTMQRIWKSYEWMLKTIVWEHKQNSPGVEQSPELKEAVSLGDDIRTAAEGK